jgi:hypothetical protein
LSRNYAGISRGFGKMRARGGAMDGPGPTMVDGMLHATSGYGLRAASQAMCRSPLRWAAIEAL